MRKEMMKCAGVFFVVWGEEKEERGGKEKKGKETKKFTKTKYLHCMAINVSATSSESSHLLQEKSDNNEVVQAEDGEKKGNSLNVIFSISSALIGSTLLILPDDFHHSGIVTAVILVFLVGASCAYSSTLLSRMGPSFEMSYSHMIGSLTKYRAVNATVLIIAVYCFQGSCMIYHSYVADGILRLANKPLNDKIRPLIAAGIGLVVFGFGCFRTLKPLFIASSYAFVAPVFCLIFIMVRSGMAIDEPFCINGYVYNATSSVPTIPQKTLLWGEDAVSPIRLATTLHLSYYVHNVILSLLKEATKPSNNNRDTGIAFSIVATAYAIPSTLGAYAFRNCVFEQDFIQQFHADVFQRITQVAIFVLVLIVYPVVLFVCREQVLKVIFGNDYQAPYLVNIFTGFIMVTITSLPCAFDASETMVGTIGGMLSVFITVTVPALVYLKNGYCKTKFSKVMHWVMVSYPILLIIVCIFAVAAPKLFGRQ